MNILPQIGETWLLRSGKPARIEFKLENNYFLCTMLDDRGYGNKRCCTCQDFQKKIEAESIPSINIGKPYAET